jgi:hypothetical protein
MAGVIAAIPPPDQQAQKRANRPEKFLLPLEIRAAFPDAGFLL